MRSAAVALALLAVLFLLARPICATQDFRTALPHASAAAHTEHSPQGSHHSDPCCDAMEASVIATTSVLAVPAAAAAPAVPAFVVVPSRITPAHPVFGAPAPPQHSYYARSARILR
jgi:hypothetical protein